MKLNLPLTQTTKAKKTRRTPKTPIFEFWMARTPCIAGPFALSGTVGSIGTDADPNGAIPRIVRVPRRLPGYYVCIWAILFYASAPDTAPSLGAYVVTLTSRMPKDYIL